MNKTGSTVAKLFRQSNKSAPEMTHVLKTIGNGDMQEGILNIISTSFKEGAIHGEKRGAIKGGTAVGCLLLGINFLIKEIRKHKADRRKIEKEKEIYQQAIEESLNESEEIAENDEGKQEEDN